MTDSIQEKSNRDRVWTTILELHNNGQVVTRQRIQELSGLTFHIVDGHVTNMIERDGLLRRVVDGVFEPILARVENQAITITDMPDGMTKIESGDQMLTLTPNMRRMLAVRLHGDAQTASNLQLQHEVGYLTHDVQISLIRQRKEALALVEEMKTEINQLKQARQDQAIQPALI
ncbi:hypothetical protein ACLS0R_11610 [Comamonas jiangduensis]|uniref:hypothetical protein n=1 Tax=Comamonas jiangduensis TaxID=1194168 RepID=UPI001C589457|nr:hypothetical protein KXJ72_11335 [Comamonas aquatica]